MYLVRALREICELINAGRNPVIYASTNDKRTDLLTKALALSDFKCHKTTVLSSTRT